MRLGGEYREIMDRALLSRVEKQAWFHRYPRGWPFLLFAIAAIITAVSVVSIERADRRTRLVELDRNLTEIASGLQRRASENVAALRAAAALFSTRETVTSEEFEVLVNDLRASGGSQSSMGIGWARRLGVLEVPTFEVERREREQADFIVFPRPQLDQGVATPIVFLSPMDEWNRRAIGYDMYSEPVRREAMDAAVRLGQPVASGRVHLVQDKDSPGSAGFLIYMPVFTNVDGQRTVKGFVYSPFRAEEFVNAAAELYRVRDVEVALYDRNKSPENLLAVRRVPGRNGATLDRRIVIGQREWIISATSKSTGALTPLSRITLIFGLIASVLAMALGWLITSRAAADRQVLEWLSRQSAIRNSLTRELNHRVKNTLANVLSIIALTRRRADGLDDFAESLSARIRALSATHDLLSESDWKNAPIDQIVHSELAPYMEGSDNHVEMSGPEISLAPNDALSLGLAIHELATNAAKYGALSAPYGRIHVRWNRLSPEVAELHWREEGGPPVCQPEKRGFGRDLIEKIVAHELRSEVDLQFKPGGVECTLQIPIRHATEFSLRSNRRMGGEVP